MASCSVCVCVFRSGEPDSDTSDSITYTFFIFYSTVVSCVHTRQYTGNMDLTQSGI